MDTSGCLGSLYNATTDHVLGTVAIQSTEKNIQEYKSKRCLITNGSADQLENFLKTIGIEDELRLSALVNHRERQGISQLLDYPHTMNEFTRLFYYSYLDREEELPDDSTKVHVRNKTSKQPTYATHVISGIQTGVNIIFLVQLPSDEQIACTIDNALQEARRCLLNDDRTLQLTAKDEKLFRSIRVEQTYSNVSDLYYHRTVFDISYHLKRMQNSSVNFPILYKLRPIRWLFPKNVGTKVTYVPLPTELSIGIEERVLRLNEAIKNIQISINKELPIAVDGRLRKQLDRLRLELSNLKAKYDEEIARLAKIVIGIRTVQIAPPTIDQILKTDRQAIISKMIDNIIEKAQVIHMKGNLLHDLHQHGIHYLDAVDYHIDHMDTIQSIQRKVILDEQRDCIMCSNDKLNHSKSEKYFETRYKMIERRHINPNVRLVYLDFSYCSFELQDLILLPAIKFQEENGYSKQNAAKFYSEKATETSYYDNSGKYQYWQTSSFNVDQSYDTFGEMARRSTALQRASKTKFSSPRDYFSITSRIQVESPSLFPTRTNGHTSTTYKDSTGLPTSIDDKSYNWLRSAENTSSSNRNLKFDLNRAQSSTNDHISFSTTPAQYSSASLATEKPYAHYDTDKAHSSTTTQDKANILPSGYPTITTNGSHHDQQSLTARSTAVDSIAASMRTPNSLPASTNKLDSISTERDNIINILLLGETGVGKSTFINAFANYLKFNSLTEAEQGRPAVIIPVSFMITVGDHFDERIVKFGEQDDSNNEDFDHPGHSVTQHCKSYVFHLNDRHRTKVRIIDTPGFGDTRGVEQDERNMEHILEYVNNLTHLNAICFLLKPNASRLNVFFRTCITQLFSLLSASALDNIIFCFTNSRSTFYSPGDTAPLLRKMLNSLSMGNVPFKKENTFCFDSESFRYLVALRNGIKFDEGEREEYEASWKASVIQSGLLMDRIRQCIKIYRIDPSFQSTKGAQIEIRHLIRPMLETIRHTLRNMILFKENSINLSIELHPKPIDSPSAICLHCQNRIIQVGKFLIPVDIAHQIRKHCLTCDCHSEQHIPVDYVLDYAHGNRCSSHEYNQMNEMLNDVCRACAEFSHYLIEMSYSSKEDLFLSCLLRLIRQEADVCKSTTADSMNSKLVKELDEVKQKYEQELNRIKSMEKSIDLSFIYERIKQISAYPTIHGQVLATKNGQRVMFERSEYEISK